MQETLLRIYKIDLNIKQNILNHPPFLKYKLSNKQSIEIAV